MKKRNPVWITAKDSLSESEILKNVKDNHIMSGDETVFLFYDENVSQHKKFLSGANYKNGEPLTIVNSEDVKDLSPFCIVLITFLLNIILEQQMV